MRKIIHVHQNEIRKGDPIAHPAIIVRTYKGSQHFNDVEICGISRIHHSADPDSCGARVWIETNDTVIGHDGEKEVRFV